MSTRMRIRLGYADGVQDLVLGEIQSTPTGIALHGKHRVWLRHFIEDARRMPASAVVTAVATDIGVTRADFQPDRVEGTPALWLRLTPEQTVRNLLDYLQHSTYYWGEEIPDAPRASGGRRHRAEETVANGQILAPITRSA